jgi:hypothetical protein
MDNPRNTFIGFLAFLWADSLGKAIKIALGTVLLIALAYGSFWIMVVKMEVPGTVAATIAIVIVGAILWVGYYLRQAYLRWRAYLNKYNKI